MPRSIAKLADDASLLLWDVPFPSFVFEALGTSIRHHLEGGSKSPSAYQNLTLPHTRVLEDSRLLAIRLREMSVDRLPGFGNKEGRLIEYSPGELTGQRARPLWKRPQPR
jgi:hypothetical protein